MGSDWKAVALEQLFSAAESKTRPLLGERSYKAPVENYRSAARLELEQQHVFAKFPILVGVSAQVRNPGDYFTHDVTGVPILVTRDREGQLRAFLNVCRHRGARLCNEPCGSDRHTFVCRYHGWSYELDGRLRGLPCAEGFPDLVRADYGLVPLPVVETEGLIFCRTQPGPEIRPAELLGQPMLDELATFGLSKKVIFDSDTKPCAGNWKLMVDSFLEGYHVPALHRATGGELFDESLGSFEPHAFPHGRFHLPFKGVARPASVDPERILDHMGVLYFVFPNNNVFFLGPFTYVLQIYPAGPERCLVRSTALIDPIPLDDGLRQGLRAYYQIYWQTIGEDIEISASIQSGFASGANRDLLLGRQECAIRERFHEALEQAMEGRLVR